MQPVNNPRILIVEDCQVTVLRMRGLIEALPGLDAQIEWESFSVRAAERLQRQPHIDAVILDLGLPNGDGLAVIRRVHASAPQVPIIVYTGTITDPEEIENGLQIGASAFVLKTAPNGDKELVKAVWRALDRRNGQECSKPLCETNHRIEQKAIEYCESINCATT